MFEHCSVVWRPIAETTINKLENIQRRAIKWILSEEGHHYNDLEYTKRLKDLDLLPLSKKFEYTDLSVFYRIYHKLSVNKLPIYLQPLDEEDTISRLRPVINPPTHMTGQDGIHKLSSMRANQMDKLSLKCSVKASSPAFKGAGGVPLGQIMETEFEYLVDRGVHGGHLPEKFLKKYCS